MHETTKCIITNNLYHIRQRKHKLHNIYNKMAGIQYPKDCK